MSLPDRSSPEQNVTIIIILVFPIAALLVVGIRIAGRALSRQFGWDDGLVCAAMALSIIETYFSYMFIKTNYLGIAPEDIPPHDLAEGFMWGFAVQLLYNPILALVKASILLFLLRLFGQKRGVRQYIACVNAANAAHMVAVLFAIVFQCTPVESAWDPETFFAEGGSAGGGAKCIDTRILFTTTAAFNILTDLLILGLPMKIFVNLKIPMRTKFALMFLFLLGILVTITSVIRMALLVQGLFMLPGSPDPDGNVGFATSAIETNLAIITASAPALRPLLRSWFPRLFKALALDRDHILGEGGAGATARRAFFFGGASTATTNTTAGARLTRIKSNKSSHTAYSHSGSQAQVNRGGFSSGSGSKGLGGENRSPAEISEEALPFATLPFNGILRRSDIHILYEPNPAVVAGHISEPRRVERFV